jgi:hypothetical protein
MGSSAMKKGGIKKRRKRRYHLADDAECIFDYELPEWLVGAD